MTNLTHSTEKALKDFTQSLKKFELTHKADLDLFISLGNGGKPIFVNHTFIDLAKQFVISLLNDGWQDVDEFLISEKKLCFFKYYEDYLVNIEFSADEFQIYAYPIEDNLEVLHQNPNSYEIFEEAKLGILFLRMLVVYAVSQSEYVSEISQEEHIAD